MIAHQHGSMIMSIFKQNQQRAIIASWKNAKEKINNWKMRHTWRHFAFPSCAIASCDN